MREIAVQSPAQSKEIFDYLKAGPILLDLGCVYALVALPTSSGKLGLDTLKIRLPGKNYGSMISDFALFIKESDLDEAVKSTLLSPQNQNRLVGSFIRLPWKRSEELNAFTKNGTHQGLIVPEPIRSFCGKMENHFLEGKLNHSGFRRLICTSANISGAPSGSITKLERARIFGEERGVSLLVRFNLEANQETGSFPIFSIDNKGYVVERKGPKCLHFETQLKSMGFSEVVQQRN
ncbi:MAG: hypothetical protein HOK65_09965 [Crocinitomicaceae bacterium]|mgnify:FL=1|nr:hypothetical protein [Crocinitomicaceae bacterium]